MAMEYSQQQVLTELANSVVGVAEGRLNRLGSMINLLDEAEAATGAMGFDDLRALMSNLMVLDGEKFRDGHNTLRETIDAMLAAQSGAAVGAEQSQEQSLYDKLGAEGAIKMLVEKFYARVMADEALAPVFASVDMGRLKRHQALFISQALGGPKTYDGRDMFEAHKGLGISEAQFARVGDHLANSLSEMGVGNSDIDTIMGVVTGLKEQIVTADKARGSAPAQPPAESVEEPAEEFIQIDEEFYQEFVTEALSHLHTIELNILILETNPGNAEIVNNIFRPFHTIKGASGFMGLKEIASICHDIENILDDARKGIIEVKGAISDLVLQAVDLLITMLQTCKDAENPHQALSQFADQTRHFLEHIKEVRANPDSLGGNTPTGEKQRLGDILVANNVVDQEKLDDAIRIQAETGKNLGEILIDQKHVKPIDVAQALRSQHGAEPAADSTPTAGGVQAASGESGGGSIRVRTVLLDQLMNLAGELVLGRNQLLQKLDTVSDDIHGLNSILNAVDRVTSEIQEAVMQTRMQPLDGLFSRFRRVVRDLSRDMGKKINLTISGETVEMDKTLIEALGDPLTHMIRNAVDHGIESPDKRREAGKPETGLITLSAYHEGGKVHVKLADDGAGVNLDKVKEKAVEKEIVTWEKAHQMSDRETLRLLFAPGFSTADQITGVSGRGVGMDVVLSNIERIGGTVEITSEKGKGSTIMLNLPLTLAIVPALIVSAQEQRFAIPQTNLLELVHLEGDSINTAIQNVRGAEVYSLRGKLLPLIRLGQVLKLETPAEAEDGLLQNGLAGRSLAGGGNSVSIVVMSTGRFQFGLIVDRVFDTEEIVVKPLSNLLRDVGVFSGTTLMGDGRAALILDITGLTKAAEISLEDDNSMASLDAGGADVIEHDDSQTILLFNINAEEQLAVPLTLISRLESLRMDEVRNSINGKVIPYRDKLLPLIFLEDYLPVSKPPAQREVLKMLVFEIEHTVGLVVSEIIDSVEIPLELDNTSFSKRGFSGMAIVNQNPTAFLDIYQVIEMAFPEWFEHAKEARRQELNQVETTILLAEDSSFYRNVEKNYLTQEGFKVIEAQDGVEALDLLKKHPVALLVTDIEMPHMNGFDLTRNIRADAKLKHLPIIAVTSLSQDEERERGMALGMDAYLVKLHREQLLAEIYAQLSARNKLM